MINCSKCKENKDSSEFNFRIKAENIRYKHCKQCQSELRKNSYVKNRKHYLTYEKTHSINRRKEKRILINDYKTGKPCKDCGEIYPHYVMDFDHLPGFEKDFQISERGIYVSIERLYAEFDKCDIVCSNCHRERTHQRKQYKKIVPTRIRT